MIAETGMGWYEQPDDKKISVQEYHRLVKDSSDLAKLRDGVRELARDHEIRPGRIHGDFARELRALLGEDT